MKLVSEDKVSEFEKWLKGNAKVTEKKKFKKYMELLSEEISIIGCETGRYKVNQ